MHEQDDDVLIVRVRDRTRPSSGGGGAVLLFIAFVMLVFALGRDEARLDAALAPPPSECTGDCIAGWGSFLAAGGGRAFVVSSNGVWSWRAGASDNRSALGHALEACSSGGGEQCRASVIGSQRLDTSRQ